MKDMTTIYTVLIEKDTKGWFISDVVELPGCHTQGKTVEQLLQRTKEAIQAYVEEEQFEISTRFVGVEHIEV